jgi:hypothetical protein
MRGIDLEMHFVPAVDVVATPPADVVGFGQNAVDLRDLRSVERARLASGAVSRPRPFPKRVPLREWEEAIYYFGRADFD